MPKTLTKKPKKVELAQREKHLLNDEQRTIIILLSKMGGFSTRAIACRIFGTTHPSRGELESVSGYRSRQGVKLRWWRDLDSPIARSFADEQVRKSRQKVKK